MRGLLAEEQGDASAARRAASPMRADVLQGRVLTLGYCQCYKDDAKQQLKLHDGPAWLCNLMLIISGSSQKLLF